ncbi:TonB-dependent siderophore receptor [Microbulbifer sp. EKSA005]|uniref:TonB-dependent siderophore receptor n=1 Tax=Microbulbifer sp. EKSA005 TaxID=3243364 RepID=UPI0040411352
MKINGLMKKKALSAWIAAAVLAPLGSSAWSAESETAETMEEVSVYGEQEETSTASRLSLSVYDTPQTVTTISQAQIQDFALQDINELLKYTPGVTVENVETDRTYYTARGFDIVNFQYDGIGVPFSSGLSHGHQDTAIFDQVEVVKGAAALTTGLANPSATVNFIRKRPTEEFKAGVDLVAGEEGRLRTQGDISGSISDNVRGRLVVAEDQADSYLDRYETDGSVYYGIVEADLTDSTTLTLGHSQNRSEADGSMSGALPLFYTNGSATDYDNSTSTAPDWAFRNVDRTQTFVELKQDLSANWSVTALLTQNEIDMDVEEMYVYGTPDRETELGLHGYAFGYKLDEKQKIADVFLSGTYNLFGRDHELVVGANYADIELTGQSFYSYSDGYPVLGSDWANGTTARPDFVDFDPYKDGHEDDQEHKSLYFATRLNITDSLSLLAGARKMEVEQSGYNYGVDADTSADETVPYVGATFDLNDSFSFYGSYTEVFTPQSWVNPEFKPLGAAEGDSSEVGFKYSLAGGQATASVGLFESNLNNLGEYLDKVDGKNVYESGDFTTKGVELELIGSITENFNISFGFTHLSEVVNKDGEEDRTYIPRNTLKVAVAYDLPQVQGLKFGGGINWQDDIYTEPAEGVRVEQDSYALLSAFAKYDISDALTVGLNIDNLTNEKYINSLYWTQGYYGAPRQAQLSVSWRY